MIYYLARTISCCIVYARSLPICWLLAFHSQMHLVWRAYLTNYAGHNVMDFLEFGWPINYGGGLFPSSTRQNHQSALAYSYDVNQTELSYQAIAGPLQYNPLHEDLVISPLQTVPRRGATRHRVVMDLSFPCSASQKHIIRTQLFSCACWAKTV